MRILNLWAQARARFGSGGDYLFGEWCAADIMFAPVVTRFVTYGVKIPPFAAAYMEAVLHRADVVEWIELAQDEPWVIEQYENGGDRLVRRPVAMGVAVRRPCSRSGRRRDSGNCPPLPDCRSRRRCRAGPSG